MIPAPEHFDSLLDHLTGAGIKVSALKEAITAYLLENNVPLNEHYNFDPVTDHQVFYYRNIIEEFLEMLE
ncbi:hypothetical protein VB264_05285 [Arcicella aquatica]|uniref:Uncharacterized protein n=1 Tax=Arcicella aquatica TaxID=217141 RepID=A0ABU5QJF3_9BACT|nr:hypothetical protein [Arcicella aquatica]MEA5257190.1 hypothetical protein [Arcicella aquatica]